MNVDRGRESGLRDFFACYNPENCHERQESERFRPFTYDDLMRRDKVSLDIFWLKDESLEDAENLPAPDALAGRIVENLQVALEQFGSIYEELEGSCGQELCYNSVVSPIRCRTRHSKGDMRA